MSGAFPGNPLVGKKIVDLPMPGADGNQPWPGFQIPAATRREVLSGRMPMRALGPLPAVGRIENSVPPPLPAPVTGSLQPANLPGFIRQAAPVGAPGSSQPRPPSGPMPPMFGSPSSPPATGAWLKDFQERQAQAERFARYALTLGLLGMILGFLTGLPAIIYGSLARRKINPHLTLARIRRQAAWGLALGYLTSIAWAIIIIALVQNGHL